MTVKTKKSAKSLRNASTRRKVKKETLLVVGIGASAGGLEAFQQFLKNLPVETGKAFVFIQHLDPAHKSALVEILSRATQLPVMEAQEGSLLERNHVYIIPPASYMKIGSGRLQLISRSKTPRDHYPIDMFFQSMAENLGERAIGVILSGTGSDGTIGLKAIKSKGGAVFVQEERSAKYPDMPRHAVSSGIADFILPPNRIAGMLGKIPHFAPHKKLGNQTEKSDENSLKRVLNVLRNNAGLDVSSYRFTTVERRILRRMTLMQKANLDDYAAYLEKNSTEVEALYKDIFIHITNFFREPEKYELLKTVIFPRLLKRRAGDPIRIWVPGCSTGEEVYSIAITLLEFLGSNALNTPLQLFASDIDDSVIKSARNQIFSKSIEQDVSPERLNRFFIKSGNGYEINKSVRELCIFAKHDINRDPPFSRLDVISCCNVLIYFTPETQLKVLRAFHYALKPSGYLILGKSESIPIRSNLFEPMDKRSKIYIKGEAAFPAVQFPKQISKEVIPQNKNPQQKSHAVIDIHKEADRIALAQYGHTGLLIDSRYRILQFRGNVSKFIQPRAGEASLNLTKMLSEDLWLPLRSMVETSKKKEGSQKKQIAISLGGQLTDINLEVNTIRHPDSPGLFFLISVEYVLEADKSHTAPRGMKKHRLSKQAAKDRYLISLERELDETKEYLRSNSEDQENINAQLNFANEELQSSNEELQSLNEEMETAKEELESGNEELTTLNEELRNRNILLARTNERLDELSEFTQSILATVREPFLVLRSDLTVKTANRAFFQTFGVNKKETEDRHLFEVGDGQWNVPTLRTLVQDVFREASEFHDFEIEHDFPQIGHRIFSLNGRRIVNEMEKEELLLLAMEDITHRKALDAALRIQIQEIHHRVKNNLQVISSLLHLQKNSIKNRKVLSLFRETENRIASMALIHEKLYMANQPGKIDFNPYLSDLAATLFRSYGVNPNRIHLKIDVEEVYLDLDIAIPCGLIITELLSNSLIHAFGQTNSGQIRIEMRLIHKDEDYKVCKMAVYDNGRGLPSEINPEASESLGMKIVTLLTRQIGGTLRVERGDGTSFQIEFPA